MRLAPTRHPSGSARERRAERLRSDAREAILENVIALSEQFRAALQADEIDAAKKIDASISSLNATLDELSDLSLRELEESDEVKQTIDQLRHSSEALEHEAATIKDLASALMKGAQAVQKASEIVGALKGLIPIA